MKRNILLTIILSFLLYSCSEILPEEGTYAYNFKEQPVQGEHRGTPFLYVDGRAESGSRLMTVTLYDIPLTDTIKKTPPFKDSIFAIPDSVIEATYGAKLKIDIPLDYDIHDLSEWDSRVICTEREKGDEHMTDGAIQITQISEKSVSGRVDVVAGTSSFFNGNFTVPLK